MILPYKRYEKNIAKWKRELVDSFKRHNNVMNAGLIEKKKKETKTKNVKKKRDEQENQVASACVLCG